MQKEQLRQIGATLKRYHTDTPATSANTEFDSSMTPSSSKKPKSTMER
ncbi:hypothetical protein [Candidatus Tisiphia endosymbiont of Nemotelus uliginosus]